MDILFKNDDFVFSYRVGGILKHNGKILLQRPKNDDYAIIGGHVAAMETSMETLKREFEEELHAKIEVDNLLAIGEIYFPWGKRPCHQICLYYNVHLIDDNIPLDGLFHGYDELDNERIEDVGRLLVRKPDSNKGTYGRTLIIAGSKNMGGAAILSASAAYRSGTGLVKVLTHEINKTALLCRMPECLISTYQDNMPLAAELKADFEWAKSIAVGPGLSMNVAAAEITRCVLERDDKVRILDADALNIIAGEHID